MHIESRSTHTAHTIVHRPPVPGPSCSILPTPLGVSLFSQGRQGRILYVFRSSAFVQSSQQLDNAGIFVTNPHVLGLVGGARTAPGDAFGGRPGVSIGAYGGSAAAGGGGGGFAGPPRGGFGGGRPPGGGGGGTSLSTPRPGFVRWRRLTWTELGMQLTGRGRGRHPLLGKTVTIGSGMEKGCLGTVLEVHDNVARVELQTKMKRISAEVKNLHVVGDTRFVLSLFSLFSLCPRPVLPPLFWSPVPPASVSHRWKCCVRAVLSRSGGGDSDRLFNDRVDFQGRFPGGTTPMYGGGATPMYGGGATPMYGGGATPNYGGGATPMHGGSRTPMHEGGASAFQGGRTPAWNPGSQTPAWEPANR